MSEGVLSIGSCMAVSAAMPATHDETGFAALTWTEWDEVTQYGDVGPESEVKKYVTVCNGNVNKRMGPKDYGQMTMEAAHDSGNAGQVIIKAAVDTVPTAPLSCRVTLPNGDISYFIAYPSNYKTKIGEASSVLMLGVNMEVDGVVVDVIA